jgi:hypothetical protein
MEWFDIRVPKAHDRGSSELGGPFYPAERGPWAQRIFHTYLVEESGNKLSDPNVRRDWSNETSGRTTGNLFRTWLGEVQGRRLFKRGCRLAFSLHAAGLGLEQGES